jgi:hypothetical protein
MPRHSRLRILQEILLVSGFALLILILLLAMPSRMLVPLGQAAAISGAVVGLATFAKAIEEYAKQGDQKRAEKFVEIQRALDDERFSRYWDWAGNG